MNKIIKLINIVPDKFNRRGGIPQFLAPNNLKNFNKLVVTLENTKLYLNKRTWFFENTVNENTDQISIIPAPSKRFIEDIKFVFGENRLEYETTNYDDENNRLLFVYDLSYDEIEYGSKRLILLKKFFQKNLGDINNICNEKQFLDFQKFNKLKWQRKIKAFAKENNLKNFSHQKIVSFISNQFSRYKNFWMNDKRFDSSGKNDEEIIFSSIASRKQAEKILQTKRILIKNKFKNTMIVKGIAKNIYMPGFLYQNLTIKKINLDTQEIKTENSHSNKGFEMLGLAKNYQYKTSDVVVGLIDGGMPNGLVKRNLYLYENAITLGLKTEVLKEETHGEEVASILMFANELDEKMSDGLKNPKVAFFDVIYSDTSISDFQIAIKKIISKYHNIIKIWNLSINFEISNKNGVINELGVFLDKIQLEYDVTFFISSGNNKKQILTPSDSFLGVAVSAYKKDGEIPSYISKGYSFTQNNKPDIAMYGGDKDDVLFVLSNNLKFKNNGGTSFAVPYAVRLASNLLDNGNNFTMQEVIALIIGYSLWNRKFINNDKNFQKYYPNGLIPLKSSKIFEVLNNQMVTVTTIKITKDWMQGFTKIKFPKFENGYDFQYILTVNMVPRLEKTPTFEYVLDSTKICFGRVNPFKEQEIKNDSKDITNNIYQNETIQRMYKGKYKSRYSQESYSIRNRASSKINRTLNKTKDIKNWGIKFERNSLNQSKKERKDQLVSIAIFAESKNKHFYQEFINLNALYISEDIKQQFDISTSYSDDDITFDD